MPIPEEKPDLLLCQLFDGKLTLPRDVRQHFLSDPVWRKEWKEILDQFDRQWGAASCAEGEAEASGSSDVVMVNSTNPYMTGEPDTLEKLKEKYGTPICEVAITGTCATFLVFSGPMLFVAGTEACELNPQDGPLVVHGAGTWLIGDKADKFDQSNPKGIRCHWVSDSVKVILEERLPLFF